MSAPPNSADGAVVAGFDGSPSAEDGLVLARACRRVLGARLVVATVHPSPAPIGSGRVDAEWTAERHHQAENILDGARRLLADDEGVEYRVVASSSAAHGLHDLAEEVNASVIVVGSSGAAAQQRLFAGSTAQRLLSGSPSPVGVAPAGMRYRDTGPLSRIGVAYIDTPDGHAALDLAVRLATRADAEDLARTFDEGGMTAAAALPAFATWRREVLGNAWEGWLTGRVALVGDPTAPHGVRLVPR